MVNTSNKLHLARQSGDPDQLASALVTHANTLTEAGDIVAARLALDEAVEIHHQQKRSYDEARCSHMAATLCRLEGKLDEAKHRATRAQALAQPGTPILTSVNTELAEIALVEQDLEGAAKFFEHAISEGQRAGLTNLALAQLLRKRAAALAISEKFDQAVQELDKAHARLKDAGEESLALRVLIESATACQRSGDKEHAKERLHHAINIANVQEDKLALADLHLLQSTQAIEARDFDAATQAVISARQYSLNAVAPLSYVSAAIALSEISELKGDRLAAYEALVVGWVTLADLLGREQAKSIFEPKLRDLNSRWGSAVFQKTKLAYEAQRKAQLTV